MDAFKPSTQPLFDKLHEISTSVSNITNLDVKDLVSSYVFLLIAATCHIAMCKEDDKGGTETYWNTPIDPLNLADRIATLFFSNREVTSSTESEKFIFKDKVISGLALTTQCEFIEFESLKFTPLAREVYEHSVAGTKGPEDAMVQVLQLVQKSTEPIDTPEKLMQLLRSSIKTGVVTNNSDVETKSEEGLFE